MTGRGLAAVAAAMSEGELEEKVRALCDDLGLFYYHTRNSRKSPSGFPDDVIAGPHGHLFRELKREREKPTPKQQAWLDRLTAAGADAGVWRPSDLLSRRIASELAAIAYLTARPVSRSA